MKRQALAVLLAAGVAAPASVQAAGGTSVPPMLRGDLEFLFDGGIDFVALEDRRATDAPWEEVARSNQQRYGLDIIGRFSPFHGLGLELEIPIVFHEAWEWGEAREFQFDPESHQATMAGGRNLAAEELNATPSAVERAGFGDMSFAVRFLPFAQAGVPGREAPASLALDLRIRFPTGQHRNLVQEDGRAGPGIGGWGVLAGASASRRLGSAEPYLSIHYVHNAPYEALAADHPEAGGEAVTLDPWDSFRLRFGAEIIALHDPKLDTAVLMDLSAGAAYVTPHEVVSNTRLPLPMDSTRGLTARTGEHLVLDGILGLILRPKPQVEAVLRFGGQWRSPHHVERITASTYTVRTTTDSFALLWTAGARVRFR